MPRTGIWHATLNLGEIKLPFRLRIDSSETGYSFTLVNGEEELTSDSVYYEGDSLRIDLPVFDSWLLATINDDGMEGTWINMGRNDRNRIPFSAAPGEQPRFETEIGPGFNVTGKWETGFFNPDDPSFKVTRAIGLFEQSGSLVTGTFLTETGDYRFLEGVVDGRDIRLSTFDGAHAYLFHGTFLNNRIEGDFWSGIHSHRKWIAERNDNLSPPDADTLTSVNYKVPVEFTFPDIEGNPVSLSDPKFKGKVVILQIMGSWCPNCMDETAYLTELYSKYHDDGLEIVTLAFERTSDPQKAASNVRKLRDHYGAGYDFLIAGTSSKDEAGEKLPFLSAVNAFPTLVFINRKGKVTSVHTGFSGPATGGYYRKFTEETEEKVARLLGVSLY